MRRRSLINMANTEQNQRYIFLSLCPWSWGATDGLAQHESVTLMIVPTVTMTKYVSRTTLHWSDALFVSPDIWTMRLEPHDGELPCQSPFSAAVRLGSSSSSRDPGPRPLAKHASIWFEYTELELPYQHRTYGMSCQPCCRRFSRSVDASCRDSGTAHTLQMTVP